MYTPWLYLFAALGSLVLPLRSSSDERAAAATMAVRDTLVTVRRGDSLYSIATRLLPLSQHYTSHELIEEIRRHNNLLSDTLLPGQELHIPLGHEYEEILNFTVPKTPDFVARGIYVNAQVAGTRRILELAEGLVEAGGNTIVFDIKDQPGDLSYKSEVPLAQAIEASARATVRNPARLISALHRRGLHVVARIACFYDTRLAIARPDLAPRSRQEEGPWYEKGKPAWVDPSLPAVQDYLLAIVEEVAGMGVDEIQLDYLRFPTEGNVEDAVFGFDPELVPGHEVITGFLKRVRESLDSTGVLLSADIFGVVGWGRAVDIRSTGQNLEDLLPLLDIVSPMLYPSHFYSGFERISNPADYPYYFVYQGCRQLSRAAAQHGVVVRPWIQAFSYRVAAFDQRYITEQLHGAEAGGARGWLLWNPASRYDLGLAAIDRFVHGPTVVDSVLLQERFPTIEPVDGAGQDPLGARLQDDLPDSSSATE